VPPRARLRSLVTGGVYRTTRVLLLLLLLLLLLRRSRWKNARSVAGPIGGCE
jgi:hypothetical protein